MIHVRITGHIDHILKWFWVWNVGDIWGYKKHHFDYSNCTNTDGNMLVYDIQYNSNSFNKFYIGTNIFMIRYVKYKHW
jgi:hypothetical protein